MFKNLFNAEFIRFGLIGTLNTLFTLMIYIFLGLILSYQIAYFIAYVLGIILSYFLNALFVFQKKVSLSTFLQFPLIYLAQYIVGAVLLGALVEKAGISKNYSPILVILLTFPLSFFLNRFVFRIR